VCVCVRESEGAMRTREMGRECVRETERVNVQRTRGAVRWAARRRLY